ncbi:MAG: Gfo/Idh/MocA family oxidoreductase [Rhodoferax sp.]|nr:Gfo/Idh/MocA family oxidoreductase [Rhodoferax sp.]
MTGRVLRIGVAGLGRAFTLMLPTFVADHRVRLVAAADPWEPARAQFARDFAAPTYSSVQDLCADPQVEVVYVATPHAQHAEQVALAAAHGKHLLVEKPMAITLEQCHAMVSAAASAKVQLVVGHSHSFNQPILQTRRLIDSGRFGAVRMLTALNFTDFLYRPRRPEELDTRAGGGVIHSQAAHQIDILRLLGGGVVETVLAQTGNWDAARPTEGAYQALLRFRGGAFASATYSGYGHFDSDALMDNHAELGQAKSPADYGAARRRLAGTVDAQDEAQLKAQRNYGGKLYVAGAAMAAPMAHQHFGPVIISCELADLRPTATGVHIYGHTQHELQSLAAPVVPRGEVIDELVAAVVHGKAPLHSAAWARATTEVCLAMLESARTGGVQTMQYQVDLQGNN